MNKKQKQLLYKNIGILFCLIIVCSILSRCGILTGGETLDEYAKKHSGAPETADEKVPLDDKQQEFQTSGEEPEGNAAATTETVQDTEKTDSAASKAQDSIEDTSMNSEGDSIMSERVTFQDGFYYEPLNENMKNRITGISYPADDSNAKIHYDDLCYVNVLYYNFNDKEKTGELICNKAIAQDLVEIFYELYQNNYQIEKIRLIDEYQGDDELSMKDNNTSCFNYRPVASTDRLSNHAYGLAIDINPFFNPYITYNKDGSIHVAPEGSEYYADREKDFAYKIDKNDLAYELFTEHGFTWGGSWNHSKDYQHFQKVD